MRFWISGEVDADIADRFRCALKAVRDVLNAAARGRDIGPIDSWDLIGIVRAVDSPTYGEIVKYHSRDRSLEFRLKIDHADFLDADDERARALLMSALLRSVNEASRVAPDGADLQAVGQLMREVAAKHGWIRQN